MQTKLDEEYILTRRKYDEICRIEQESSESYFMQDNGFEEVVEVNASHEISCDDFSQQITPAQNTSREDENIISVNIQSLPDIHNIESRNLLVNQSNKISYRQRFMVKHTEPRGSLERDDPYCVMDNGMVPSRSLG